MRNVNVPKNVLKKGSVYLITLLVLAIVVTAQPQVIGVVAGASANAFVGVRVG